MKSSCVLKCLNKRVWKWRRGGAKLSHVIFGGSVAVALEAKAAVFMKAFESLLRHPAPGFACHVARDRLKIEGFVAPVAHRAKLGATTRDLEKIPDIVGGAAVREFYAA